MKFNKQLLIIKGFTLTLFIALTSCSNDGLADYTVNGTVTDGQTSKPIKNIRVIRKSTEYMLYPDTTYTDSIGQYSFEFVDYYDKKASFSLKAEDIDLSANLGTFITQDVKFSFSSSDWDQNSSLKNYKGEAFKTVNIILSK